MNATPNPMALLRHFQHLPDPRVERTRAHLLLDMIAIAICAALCGADDWVAVARFGRAKIAWLQTFLTLPNGIPSHDTFTRVFAKLDPAAFAECFQNWMAAICERLGLKQVAIDGKTVRRSHDRSAGKAALHLVSAWATENRITLGQVPVDGKSNEITAIPTLLRLLDIEGALVTIDAMGCQKEIAEDIRGQGADYLLAVKENQPRLYADMETMFQEALASDFAGLPVDEASRQEKGHGRKELRGCYVFTDLGGKIRDLELWRDLRSVVVVVSDREIAGKASSELRYYISSRIMGAEAFGEAVRSHWGIENGCHWILDVCFDEDRSRLRKDNGAENFALLRRLALSILKRDKTVKVGTKNKRLNAGWDESYLEQLLYGFGNE